MLKNIERIVVTHGLGAKGVLITADSSNATQAELKAVRLNVVRRHIPSAVKKENLRRDFGQFSFAPYIPYPFVDKQSSQ